MVKCPISKHEMKVDYIPMTFKINPNVIVQNVKVHKCVACGFESVPEDEYERVRKKVHETSKVGKEAIVVTKIER